MKHESDDVDFLGHIGLFLAVAILGIAVATFLAFLGWI